MRRTRSLLRPRFTERGVSPTEVLKTSKNEDEFVLAGLVLVRQRPGTASGVVFVSSSMFQAMGNTLPALAASFVRIVVVAIPAFLLSRVDGFALRWIWYLSVVAITVQLGITLLLLRREFHARLNFAPGDPAVVSRAAP